MNPSHLPPPTIVDLLRHGQPEGGDRYRGSLDDPLSRVGWEQMEHALAHHQPWQLVVTSPLKRCAAFAQELAGVLGVDLEVEGEFREMGFGRWEGRTTAAILEDDRERLVNFWKDPRNNPPPGGEHLDQVRERVVGAWEGMIQRHPGKHILLVTHGGVIRVILGHVLGMPFELLSRLLVPYAALSRIQVDRLGELAMPRLVFHHGRPG